jgi:hypothetical protein
MMLIGVVLHVILGMARNPCNFIMETVLMVAKLAMSIGKEDGYDAAQSRVLEQLPCDLRMALKNLNVDGNFTTYAVCPACQHLHPPIDSSSQADALYPKMCDQLVPGKTGLVPCATLLAEKPSGRIKPYVLPSFTEYLSRLLSDPKAEQLCDQACDDAMERITTGVPLAEIKTAFEADFLKEFDGPTVGKLFVDRGDKARLAFMLQLDFFNPNASTKRSSQSVGVITCVCLNLPEDMRYKSEYLYIAVIPGPKMPDDINPFLSPIVDVFLYGWHRGYHLSRTASSEAGRNVELAIVLSANDIPAARKISGTAASTSNRFFCTCCDCRRAKAFTSDWESWKPRDVETMRLQAGKYRDATTVDQQTKIFKSYGVRWSELWRLPYWNPSRMLVTEAMHNLLHGLIDYHCRNVLILDVKKLKKRNTFLPRAFLMDDIEDYEEYHEEDVEHYPLHCRVPDIGEIDKAVVLLETPIEGPGSLNIGTVRKRLAKKHIAVLRFMAYSLQLGDKVQMPNMDESRPVKTKAHLAEQLIQWVSVMQIPVVRILISC